MSTPTPATTHSASETIAPYEDATQARAVKILRNGANQVVRIPMEFELPGTQALMHREGTIEVLPLDPTVSAHYAQLRTHLEQCDTPIGPNDTFIAAHALALDCTLVTDNETEFRRVPGLRVENWLTGISP